MDPLSISLAIAPLLLASAQLTKQIGDFTSSYKSAPIILTSISSECNLIHVALCNVQGLVHQSTSVLTSQLSSDKGLREAFDGALTGCRMTVAAVDVEISRFIDSEASGKDGNAGFGFRKRTKYVWKEELMQGLLDQTRGQMASIQFLITVLQSETIADILRLVRTNREPVRENLSKARSIRSRQGFDDTLSTFDSDGHSIAHSVVPTHEKQLQQSTAYKKAQAVAAEDLLAAKLELLEDKYALEDKVECLERDINLKESSLGDMRSQVAAKDASIDRMDLELRRTNDTSKKLVLKKNRVIAILKEEVEDLKRQTQTLDDPDSPTQESLVSDTESDDVHRPNDRPDICIRILGRSWTFDSPRTPPFGSSAPNILFYWAANNGDAEAARYFYGTQNVDGTYVDPKTDMNALQIATRRNFPSVVETILTLGLPDGHHQALRIAVDQGHLEIVRSLTLSGARISQLPLSAVEDGHEEIVKIMIASGVDISDASLLACATEKGHFGIIEALTTVIDPHHRWDNTSLLFNEADRALETAAFTGNLYKLYQALLYGSEEFNDLAFQNAMHFAIENGDSRVLRLLLTYLLNPVDQGSARTGIIMKDALDFAVSHNRHSMLFILKKHEDKQIPSPTPRPFG